MRVVGITGGIGSGKSVISRLLRMMGYPVYDSDEQAKRLMDASTYIQSALVAEFGEDVCRQGILDRRRLASIVFADPQALRRLNAIVHPAVKKHFLEWCRKQKSSVMFMESAILVEAGFTDVVDTIWLVTAPEKVRIERIVRRNDATSHEAKQRILSQQSDADRVSFADAVIVNDGQKALIPQLLSILSLLQ